MSPVRVALLGYGLAGRVLHAPLLRTVAATEVTHVVTASPERSAQARADLPSAQVLPSPERLWAHADDFDAVVVAAPDDAHVPLARDAVERGKAVVVDKPLALSSAAAAGLVADARRAGVVLTVFQNRRWDSDTLTARALLAGGALGTVHRLESRFTRFRPQVADRWRERPGSGGVLLDLGSHLVDQAVHLLGPVASVDAQVAVRRPGAVVDDDCLLWLRHASGADALLACSLAAPWPGPRLVLQGSAAGWAKSGLDGQEDAQRRGAAPQPEPPGELVDAQGRREVPSVQGDWPAFYAAFAAAVRGAGPVPVDPQDAVDVLRVLEAARTASAERRVVAVAPTG